MVVTNNFLKNIGLSAIRGEIITTPKYVYWAGSDNTYTGAEETIDNEFIDKGVVWIADGIDNKFNVELTTADAIGSYIETFGLKDTNDITTGSPLVIIPSDVGLKSNSFSVEVEGRILFRRPG